MMRFESCLIYTELLGNGGKLMQLLEEDPVKYIPIMLDFEFDPNKHIIAQKLIEKYFDPAKSFKDQFDKIEKASHLK